MRSAWNPFLDDVAAAAEAGADRVELCAGLFEGGITPERRHDRTGGRRGGRPPSRSTSTIRPRGGDFIYSESETAVMLRDIETAKLPAPTAW